MDWSSKKRAAEQQELRARLARIERQLDTVVRATSRQQIASRSADNVSPPSKQKVLRQWGYVYLGALVAIVATVIGTQSFGESRPTAPKTYGQIALAATLTNGSLGRLKSADLEKTNSIVNFTYFQGIPQVDYDIAVDPRAAGQQISLLLVGDARLTEVKIEPPNASALDVRNSTCVTRYQAEPTNVPCQQITATLPSTIDANLRYVKCDAEIALSSSLHIYGKPASIEHGALFDKSIELPLILPNFTQSETVLQPFLTPGTSALKATGCRRFAVGGDYTVTNLGIEPDLTGPAGFTQWNSTYSNTGILVGIKYRNAERWGNFLIVTAGAAAAGAIGFFPIAYESTARRRRWRKRQADVSESSQNRG